MKELVDKHYPDALRIRVVLDNLNTHRASALYEFYEPAEARRLLRRLEFHYTPKHGSWLNMVEIEIGVLSKQCLDRRIGDIQTLRVTAWEQQRNASGARITWLFKVEDARRKLSRLYPRVRPQNSPNRSKPLWRGTSRSRRRGWLGWR